MIKQYFCISTSDSGRGPVTCVIQEANSCAECPKDENDVTLCGVDCEFIEIDGNQQCTLKGNLWHWTQCSVYSYGIGSC